MDTVGPVDSNHEMWNGEAARSGDVAAVAGDISPDAPTQRQKLVASALCFWGFLVFYLLSAGPVAGLHRIFEVRSFQKAVEVIYAPVVLLVKSNVEPFSSMMKWYVDLFR